MEKSTSPQVLTRWMRGWFLLFALGLAALAWAAPDYVTNWPKQVPVEKPDPVMGDKPFMEIWAYSKEFARRFKGFSIEKADADFSTGTYAIVFRAYKEVIFKGYPEQYRCEYDFYFDNSIQIPFSDKPTWIHKYKYPVGVSESYKRLDAVDDTDRQALRDARPAPFDAQQRAVLLADGQLDGRFATLGIGHYPNIVPGLSMARLTTMFNCQAMAPKRDDTHYWISLLGNRPEGPLSKTYGGYGGGHLPNLKGSFDPGLEPVRQGYFRIPETFYQTVLPKVTLIKVLNDCIGTKYVHTLPNDKTPVEQQKRIAQICRQVEEQGVIYDFYKQRHGLYKLGF